VTDTIADVTMPDPVILAKELLQAASAVTALVSTRILSRTGDPLPARPYVRLDLAGGIPVDDRALDAARIQVHVFGANETEPATLTVARTVRAAFVHSRNYVGTVGVVVGCDTTSPQLLPDLTHSPPLVDATFTVTLYTHP
jgi:hypothetical protein